MEKVIDKIRKLLALSASSNEHEAVLAMQKAQELLEKHNLSLYDVHKKKFSSTVEEKQNLFKARRYQIWKKKLISGIAKIFNVTPIITTTKEGEKIYSFVGFPTDIEVALFFIEVMEKKIKDFSLQINRHGLNSFRLGMVIRISEKLKEYHEQQIVPSTSREMVLVKEKEISDFLTHHYPDIRKIKASRSSIHSKFLNLGYRKGDSISIHDGLKDNGTKKPIH